ncbi:MAG: hypothetical protein IPM50_02810 [Acidobacteriota bacterium]|nr:MAG: hypothetical protein IPM50_02810 [Acidobacteriota bacterium]
MLELSEYTYFDELDFRAYFRRFRAVILAADAAGADDPEYRGLTVGEINRRLGDHANKQWTADCLQMAAVFRAGLVPERYSFRRRDTVRSIPRDQWDSIPRPECRRHYTAFEIPMHERRSRRQTY